MAASSPTSSAAAEPEDRAHTASGVDEKAPSLLADFTRAAGLLAAEGASLGLCAWSLRVWGRLEPYVATNALPTGGRRWVMINMGVGAGLGVAIALALVVWRRRAGVEPALRLARRAAPLALAGFVPLLFNWRLWVDRNLAFVVLLGTVALSLQALTRLALETPPVFGGLGPLRPRLSGVHARLLPVVRRLAGHRLGPLLVVSAAALYSAIFFSFHTVQMHYKLGTSAFDLGLENNLVWNAIHWEKLFKTSPLGGPTGTYTGLHQPYLAYVLGIFYRFAPRPETLLVAQATLVSFAAVPLYFVARRRLSPWIAAMIGVFYVLYPPVHGSTLYDYHYIALAPFFLLLTLAMLLARRDVLAGVAVVLTLSVREDAAALLAVLGGYLVISGERPRAGTVVAAIGAIYFVTLKFLIMPRYFAGVDAYINQYEGLLGPGQKGFSGVLNTVFGNPGFTLQTLLEGEKLRYTLQIAAPLAFLPWRRPIGLWCSVPGFFFTLLSTDYWPLLQISFQYSAYWAPFLFIALIANLAWVQQHLPRASMQAWLVALTFAMLSGSYQHGALLQKNTVWGGFEPFRFGITDQDRKHHDDLYYLIGKVPPDAHITSSERVVPHVSSRRQSYSLRGGIHDAEYLLVRRGLRGDERQAFRSALEDGTFGVVEERGEFILAIRGHATEKNAALLESNP
jgi:uncharacterized membrane protein